MKSVAAKWLKNTMAKNKRNLKGVKASTMALNGG